MPRAAPFGHHPHGVVGFLGNSGCGADGVEEIVDIRLHRIRLLLPGRMVTTDLAVVKVTDKRLYKRGRARFEGVAMGSKIHVLIAALAICARRTDRS
jgi:hypothetical protein